MSAPKKRYYLGVAPPVPPAQNDYDYLTAGGVVNINANTRSMVVESVDLSAAAFVYDPSLSEFTFTNTSINRCTGFPANGGEGFSTLIIGGPWCTAANLEADSGIAAAVPSPSYGSLEIDCGNVGTSLNVSAFGVLQNANAERFLLSNAGSLTSVTWPAVISCPVNVAGWSGNRASCVAALVAVAACPYPMSIDITGDNAFSVAAALLDAEDPDYATLTAACAAITTNGGTYNTN